MSVQAHDNSLYFPTVREEQVDLFFRGVEREISNVESGGGSKICLKLVHISLRLNDQDLPQLLVILCTDCPCKWKERLSSLSNWSCLPKQQRENT